MQNSELVCVCVRARAGLIPFLLFFQPEQENTIRHFRQGHLNLLISTSVAEEGLDIPECNLVVRYGLLTNEIAQMQASGRARARNSQYSVVAQKHGREVHRERINDYLGDLAGKAMVAVQDMTPLEFRCKVRFVVCSLLSPTPARFLIPTCPFSLQITEMQTNSIRSRRAAESKEAKRRSQHAAASVQLLCRNCFKQVASGSDIRLVDNTHYVNVNPSFKYVEL